MVKYMNCLWIILLLACFGGCGNNGGCGSNSGRSNGGRNNNNSCGCDGGGQRNRCSRAVENAVDECGSERAVMRTLRERDGDCRPEMPSCPEARENNSCDVPGMNPPHWQDFPEVSRGSSRDDCGCDA